MYTFLLIATLIVIATITKGVIDFYNGKESNRKNVKRALRINLCSLLPVLTGIIVTSIPKVAYAEGAVSSSSGLGFIAAALSTGLAAVGAGIAVAAVGSSALGAVSEDPKILGKTLIFVGLAEGIAIYGLIISIMILGRL
ncbi:V/A-type H+-transporting ATPase subunit K [Caloramator quimbayensis]|uniref:V/A-type H+-transporting ATPase subunit K n=1 Tax=Caloramator quimbayensis TaxID=1147123 RepID=A0A1T4XMA1_9CLOT|nr:ATP synthase subunit C [Caloramator quimbayensis]SKA90523.1 V/A-type H+-transporting ATPase subunit K [Caloramator quimbayensis]